MANPDDNWHPRADRPVPPPADPAAWRPLTEAERARGLWHLAQAREELRQAAERRRQAQVDVTPPATPTEKPPLSRAFGPSLDVTRILGASRGRWFGLLRRRRA